MPEDSTYRLDRYVLRVLQIDKQIDNGWIDREIYTQIDWLKDE